ncbi:MAG: DUF2332 domain-containing protein [Actinomycetota bacterium]|nr:DUF2332 domain-containing protein [Actinomycetota bacterium]
MFGLEPGLATAENYRRFARREAAGRSPAYESLALAVADDGVLLGFLARLPAEKRQPNLLFAAARYLLDDVPDVADLRRLVTDQHDRLVEVLLERRTQTNEPARCATILPALWRLPQPLALIEVGASAGLTLLVDTYSYDYDGVLVAGTDPQAPTLSCHLGGPAPLPGGVPEVVWRQGIDLNPLNPANDDDVRWLECLIWPGEDGRAQRLREAVAAARRHPVTVRPGDLLDDLAMVVADAPRDATLVVFHTAVLAYVDVEKRAAFADALGAMGVTWLSNEAPGVLDWLPTATDSGGFILVEDGRTILAETDPHGTWLRWR